MDAAIAAEQATAAKSRASIATLEFQRASLGMPTLSATPRAAGMSWIIVVLVAAAAFAAGTKVFESHPDRHWSAAFSQ
jgi:hypothetical protein